MTLGTAPMPTLDELNRLDDQSLSALWRRTYGRPLPAYVQQDTVARCISYHMQTIAHGGLSKTAQTQLRRLAAGSSTSSASAPGVAAVKLKPGTRLLREWDGQTHTVTVLAKGFSYNDRTYQSLSEIARLITGTRWSGPLFFGLRAKPEKR